MCKPLFLLIFLLVIPINTWADGDVAGSLRAVKGTSTILRNETERVAKNGENIHQGDIIKTGSEGSLGIIFNDNSRISLGPNSELTVTQYIFKPAQNKFGLLAKIKRGTASYVSGKISKLAPQSVSFETPNSTIGTRGTSFLIKVGG